MPKLFEKKPTELFKDWLKTYAKDGQAKEIVQNFGLEVSMIFFELFRSQGLLKFEHTPEQNYKDELSESQLSSAVLEDSQN